MTPLVFLFDVDNTLLDNDTVGQDLRGYLQREVGSEAGEQYWRLFEELRRELGYADYLGALERFRLIYMHDPRLLRMGAFLIDYPFRERLFPGVLEALRWAGSLGTTVILSDGDAVFQPRKVERSGLWDAVEGRVLIYIHKEEELECVRLRYPARHYVLIDDKPRILEAVKHIWREDVTTIFVRQGHYAREAPDIRGIADVTLERIGDLPQAPGPWVSGGAGESNGG